MTFAFKGIFCIFKLKPVVVNSLRLLLAAEASYFCHSHKSNQKGLAVAITSPPHKAYAGPGATAGLCASDQNLLSFRIAEYNITPPP